MDPLDFGILKILLANNGAPPGVSVLRRSFRSMAKELDVDQATVRHRIKKFQEQRVLRGWYLGVSPGLSGKAVVNAWFGVGSEAAKNELIEKLLANRNVERACSYLGPKVSFVLFCSDGTSPEVALQGLAKLAGPKAVPHEQGVIRVPAYPTKQTDLAIIGSLRRDPWKAYSAVAKELGLSARTVKRRTNKLSEDGLIYMLPIVDLKALQGVIAMELVVNYASREVRTRVHGRIVSLVHDGLVFSDSSGPYGYFALVVPNVSQVEQITSRVRQLDGVSEVQATVLQEVVLNRRHYERPQVPRARSRGYVPP